MLGAYPVSRKLVMADPSVCIGCKTCMAACLVRHDTPDDVAIPRLVLVTTRTISAPVGCHHCAEAPCVDACPVGCLFSDDDHVGVHPGKCIGCRNCVLACPYGAVDIVTRTVVPELSPEPEPESEAKAQEAPKGSARDRARARAKKRRSSVSTVVKCDLCVKHADGPACAHACPTHALRLIDPEMMERGKQAKQRAAAQASASFASLALNTKLNEER